MHVRDCGCASNLRFFDAASDGATANRQIPDRIFGQFFYQFEEGQRRQLCIDLDSVFTDCQRIGCALQGTKRFIVTSVGGATRFANVRQKFSRTQKNGRRLILCQILCMIAIEVVINSTRVMGVRVIISCRYALPSMGRCLCFQLFLSVTLRGRRAVRSRVIYFEQVLCRGLWVDFDTVCNVFSIDCPFIGTRYSSYFCCQVAPQNFAKLRSKIAKSPKIGGKVCAHDFVQIA